MAYGRLAIISNKGDCWFFILFGVLCFFGGALAIIKRRSVARGRWGHVERHSGRRAVIQGILALLLGFLAVTVGVVGLL